MTVNIENKTLIKDCVAAVCFVRKVRGGSQSCLLGGNDGKFYIVKLLENPQGSQILLNEAFGTELMQMIGFRVPRWRPIIVSDEFIDRNPGLWFEATALGRQRPPAGLHFGSEFIAPGKDETLYELLPRSWFEHIRDRENFIGMLLFDMWAQQQDTRQAVFLRNVKTRSISTFFVDQGCLFGNCKDGQETARVRAMFVDPMIYADLDVRSVVPKWEARIRALDRDNLNSLVNLRSIPLRWYTPSTLEQIVSGLIDRQASVEEYGSQILHYLCSNLGTDKLRNVRDGQSGEISIHDPQLRTERCKRTSHSMPRLC